MFFWVLMGLFQVPSDAQSEFSVAVKATWNDQDLIAGEAYLTENGEWFRLNILKFYIHNPSISSSDGQKVTGARKHYLIDLLHAEQEKIEFFSKKECIPDSLFFSLGVDSLTQSAGALGMDLDPANGMYWTWQSGYIHIKIEGTSSLSKHPSQEFACHIGGYRMPFNSIRDVELKICSLKEGIVLNLDLASFFRNFDVTSNHHIMSPSGMSSKLADVFASCFQITHP